jgi:hypothetical protein
MLTLVDERAIQATESTDTERRRGLRIHQARPVKVFDASAAKYFPGQTHDVSATGLRLELPLSAPIHPGKLLNIHVGLSESGQPLANRRQMVPARVVWVRRGESAQQSGRPTLTLGIEFIASTAAYLDAA